MYSTLFSNKEITGSMVEAVDNYVFLLGLTKHVKLYARLPVYTEAAIIAEIYYELFTGFLADKPIAFDGMTIADLYNNCVIHKVEYNRSIEDLCFDMETWKLNYCNYKRNVSRINMNNAIASFPDLLRSLIFAKSHDKDLLVKLIVDEFDSTLKDKAIIEEVAELIPDSVMEKGSYSMTRDAIMQILNQKL